MRIRVLSDLHLECFTEGRMLPDVAADLVVLAGDIHSSVEGLDWVVAQFPETPILFVPGNHEFYGTELEQRRAELAEIAHQTGIHLLDNATTVVEGVRFIGTTLWTDFELYSDQGFPAEKSMEMARRRVPDFRTIRLSDSTFTPEQARALHRRDRAWLEAELARPFDGPTVVVSHHAPLAESIPSLFRGDLLSPAFASRLDHLMGQMTLWIHGHVHEPVDLTCNGTRVIANPGGYPGEFTPPKFDGGLVVEV